MSTLYIYIYAFCSNKVNRHKNLHVDHKQGINLDASPVTFVKETPGFAALSNVEEARANAPNIFLFRLYNFTLII